MFTRSRKVWKSGERQYTVMTKQQVKDEQIKRKQTCSLFFKSVWIPRKQVQDCSKEFLEKIIILIIKRFLGKATGHNDNYMVSMGGQRPKIDGNWPLTNSYLQHCHSYCNTAEKINCILNLGLYGIGIMRKSSIDLKFLSDRSIWYTQTGTWESREK